MPSDQPSDAQQSEPPVRAVVAEAASSRGVGAAVEAIEEACRSGGRFAVLVDARGASETAATGLSRRALMGRLRVVRPAMRQRCAGVVFLTTPDALARQRRRLRAARAMLSCPVEAVASLDDATGWLAARGVTVPDGPDGVRP